MAASDRIPRRARRQWRHGQQEGRTHAQGASAARFVNQRRQASYSRRELKTAGYPLANTREGNQNRERACLHVANVQYASCAEEEGVM